jgi:hypothetical protein
MLLLIADELGGPIASPHGTHTLVVHKEFGRLIVSVFSGIHNP